MASEVYGTVPGAATTKEVSMRMLIATPNAEYAEQLAGEIHAQQIAALDPVDRYLMFLKSDDRTCGLCFNREQVTMGWLRERVSWLPSAVGTATLLTWYVRNGAGTVLSGSYSDLCDYVGALSGIPAPRSDPLEVITMARAAGLDVGFTAFPPYDSSDM